MIDTILQPLRETPLTDIYVPGFIDDGYGIPLDLLGERKTRRFAPRWDEVYFEFEHALVKMSSVEQGGFLKMEIVDSFSLDFEIDDQDQHALSSFIWALLGTRSSVKVLALDVWSKRAADIPTAVVAAAGLSMENGRYLFLDPMTFDGIAPGGPPERDAWLSQMSPMAHQQWTFP